MSGEAVHYLVELAMPVDQYAKWKSAKLEKYTYKDRDWGSLGSAPHPTELEDLTVAACLDDLRALTVSSMPRELVDKAGTFAARGCLDGDDFDAINSALSTAVRAAGDFGATGGLTYAYDEIGGGTRIVVGPVPKKKITSLVRDATEEEIVAAEPPVKAKRKPKSPKKR